MIERIKFTDRGDQCWAVKDGVSAVEFRVIVATDQPVAIVLHSLRPVPCIEPGPCDLVDDGRCYADLTFVGGRDLHRTWVNGQRDDEVIWGALESWYRP